MMRSNHKTISLLNTIMVIYGSNRNFSFKEVRKYDQLENIRRLNSFHLGRWSVMPPFISIMKLQKRGSIYFSRILIFSLARG